MIKKTCLGVDCPEHIGGECTAYAEVPMSARREESELAYQVAKVLGNTMPLEQEPHIGEYQYWILIKNRFPYDLLYKEHDMLIPRSGVANRINLNVNEILELNIILDTLDENYDLVFENFKHRRSVLGLFHLHLARLHKSRQDIKL